MDTRKLLIADASAEFCTALAHTLGGAYDLRICHDGFEARAMLDSFQPDVLVADLTLPGLDGLSLLKAAAAGAYRPAMLILTRFMSSYIERVVEQIGIDYLMMKPCDLSAVAERICDLAERPKVIPVPVPVGDVTLTDMLLMLGVSIGSRGFQCLDAAVTLYEQSPNQSVTKVLYPAVARICGGRKEAVERVIRTAISRAWERRDEKIWRLFFTPCRDGFVCRPTNTVFIATLAERLRRQNQSEAQ